MNIPGFTAEASVYRTVSHYAGHRMTTRRSGAVRRRCGLSPISARGTPSVVSIRYIHGAAPWHGSFAFWRIFPQLAGAILL